MEDLTRETSALRKQVEALANRLHVSQQQVHRTRILTRAVLAIAAGSLVLAVITGINVYQTMNAVEDTEENAVTACENANESRDAQRILWSTIIAQSAASNPDRSPDELEFIEEFQAWVDELFEHRDCTDLSREYPVPEPPTRN